MVHGVQYLVTDLLFQQDLRGSFAVETEGSVGQLDDGAHGLADGVKGVDLVELVLWNLLPHRGVVSLQVQHEAQQGTLSLITHLLGQATLLISRLGEGIKTHICVTKQEETFENKASVYIYIYICKNSFH